MVYTCHHCTTFSTPRKANYIRHLMRKNKCQKVNTIEIATLLQEVMNNKYIDRTVNVKTPKNTIVFFCKYCNKQFTKKHHKQRHETTSCKHRQSQQTNNDQVCKPTTVNVYNQQINNYNIKINNYGKENLEYLTQDFVRSLFALPYSSVPNLLKHIHFHPDHPENHTVQIPNKKQNLILVHKNGGWVYRQKQEIIEDMVDKGYNLMDDYLEDKYLIVRDLKKQRFIEFQYNFQNDPRVQKNIKKQAEVVILNGQTQLKRL